MSPRERSRTLARTERAAEHRAFASIGTSPRGAVDVSVRAGFAWVWLLASCNGSPDDASPTDRPLAAQFSSSRVAASLAQLTRAAATRGYMALGEPRRGFLVERGPEVVPVALRSGNCCLLVAAGSEGIRELELALYDGEGAEVARDTTSGRVAVLHHCPFQSGTFYATVEATAGHGLYALRELVGPTGLDVRPEDVARAVDSERPSR